MDGPDDEIVVVMSQSDFRRLDLFLASSGDERLQRLLDYAEIITLEWLDKKRTEFP